MYCISKNFVLCWGSFYTFSFKKIRVVNVDSDVIKKDALLKCHLMEFFHTPIIYIYIYIKIHYTV